MEGKMNVGNRGPVSQVVAGATAGKKKVRTSDGAGAEARIGGGGGDGSGDADADGEEKGEM